MDTGGIAYSGTEYLAVAASEAEAKRQIAAAFDEALAREGDDREPWLEANGSYHGGYTQDEADACSSEFGETLDAFAEELNGYYGIGVYEIEEGKATTR
jgi:hypothetical protein